MTKAEQKILKIGAGLAMLAFIALISGQALAASPKMNGVVDGEHVRLGDVFEGVQKNADYILAPAPQPGKTLVLNAHDLQRISDAFDLGWIAQNTMAQVTLRRAATVVEREMLEKTFHHALSAELGGRDIELELVDRRQNIVLNGEFSPALSVKKISLDAARNLATATIDIRDADKKVESLTLTARYYPVMQVPVLTQTMRKGDVISKSDIEYIAMRSDAVTSAILMDEKDLLGKTPRRGISAGRPMIASDVQLPELVAKGDIVTMMLQNGALSLTVQGKALDDGAKGETVRIMNTASNKVVEAVVLGSQKVAVQPIIPNTL